MDNVTKFPAEEIRKPAKLEKSIRAGVRKAGVPRHLEDAITAELTGLFNVNHFFPWTTIKIPVFPGERM